MFTIMKPIEKKLLVEAVKEMYSYPELLSWKFMRSDLSYLMDRISEFELFSIINEAQAKKMDEIKEREQKGSSFEESRPRFDA